MNAPVIEIEIPVIASKDFGGEDGRNICPAIFTDKTSDVGATRVLRFATAWLIYREEVARGATPWRIWGELLGQTNLLDSGVLRTIVPPRGEHPERDKRG